MRAACFYASSYHMMMSKNRKNITCKRLLTTSRPIPHQLIQPDVLPTFASISACKATIYCIYAFVFAFATTNQKSDITPLCAKNGTLQRKNITGVTFQMGLKKMGLNGAKTLNP